MKNNLFIYTALTVIILLALFVRLPQADKDLPYLFHPDEYALSNSSYEGIRYNTFDPGYYLYPPYSSYLYQAIDTAYLKLSDLKENIEPKHFYLLNRYITIFLSLFSIAAMYLLGRISGGNLTGIISALFMSVSMLHLEYSVLIKADMGMLFFSVMALIFIIKAATRPTFPVLFAAFMFSGAAVMFKINALVLVIPLAGITLANTRTSGRNILLSFMTAAAAVMLTLLPVYEKLGKLLTDSFAAVKGYENTEGSLINFFHLKYLFTEGFGFLTGILAAGGLYLYLRSKKNTDNILSVTALSYFIVMLFMKANYSRHLLILIPFLSLFAADFLVRKIKRAALILPAVLIAITPNLYSISGFIKNKSPEDNRITARNWILNHIPEDASLIYEHMGPPLCDFDPAINANPSLIIKGRDFTLCSERFNSRKLVNNDYFVLSSYPAYSQELAEKGKLVKEFTSNTGNEAGGVRIYRNTASPEPVFISTEKIKLNDSEKWFKIKISRDINPGIIIFDKKISLVFTDTKRNKGYHFFVQQSDLTAFFEWGNMFKNDSYIKITASWPTNTRISVYIVEKNGVSHKLIEGKRGLNRIKTLYLPVPEIGSKGIIFAFSTHQNAPHTDETLSFDIYNIETGIIQKKLN